MQNDSWRPSPGTIFGLLAIVIALGGTAVARQTASTSVVSTKKVKKIAASQIQRLAPSLSVASANTANSANTASTAASANPIAFARVNSGGGVDEANTKGLTDANVVVGDTGEYCFTGLGFAFKGAQVTADVFAASTDEHPQFGKGGCLAAGTQARVVMFDNAGVATPAGFYIAFYN